MDDAPKESRRGARVRWEALPTESGRSPTSTWSESVGGTPPDTPTPEKGTEGLDIPPWLVQAERMLLEGQSPPFPVAAVGLPAMTGAEEMDMARWLDDAESMLHPAPPDASATSAPEAPSFAGAAAYDKSLIGDYTPNGTSVYGYDRYDARGGAATTPRAAPSRGDARSSLAGCEGEGRAQACLWTPPVGGTAATIAAARAQQAAEAAAAKVVAAERALQEAAAAKAAAQAAAEEAMAAAAAEMAVAEGGRRRGGASLAAGGAEDAARAARARGEATATSTPPLRPPPPTPPPPFAQPRASASPPLRPPPAAAVPPAPAGRPRGASAPLPGSGGDAALAPSFAAAAVPAAAPAAAARRASESRGAAAPSKRKAWSARRGVVLTVLTAHGLLSPVAFHGWWCVPRIALLLPLLPVVDINFASPDGELLGNTFFLSRVLTLADLLSIITRGDALMQPTYTIYQDFQAACAWYVRCAIGFVVVCFLGSKLRRRMFNACFALAGLALIACEIIMFGFVWPLAGAVLATVVLSLEPEKALERRFLKSD